MAKTYNGKFKIYFWYIKSCTIKIPVKCLVVGFFFCLKLQRSGTGYCITCLGSRCRLPRTTETVLKYAIAFLKSFSKPCFFLLLDLASTRPSFYFYPVLHLFFQTDSGRLQVTQYNLYQTLTLFNYCTFIPADIQIPQAAATSVLTVVSRLDELRGLVGEPLHSQR